MGQLSEYLGRATLDTMAEIIAILNQKGGVGKTTTAINLAAYLARLKQRVLVIDLDPQGNATSGLGLSKADLQHGTHDVLLGHQPLHLVVQPAVFDGQIFVLPTGQSLATAEIDLINVPGREHALARALNDYVAQYDYILIDCPPSLSLLTVNALTAATSLIIPVQSEYYALEGLTQLLEIVQQVRGGLNPDLELLGVLLTMFDARTTLSDQVKGNVAQYFGDKVFDTVVPRNVRLAEAPSHGKSIHDYDKWSKGARAYKALAKEVHKRSGGRSAHKA